MNSDELRATFLDLIDSVAPGSIPEPVDDDGDIRDQMDLDSMDLLNVVVELHKQLGVEIPEADIEQITTVNKAMAYLENAIRSLRSNE